VAAMDTHPSNSQSKKSKSKSSNPKKKKGNKDSPKKGKKNKGKYAPKADKFDKDKPDAYVTADVWKAISKEEKQAARDKRREQGIPTRNVSGIVSHRNVSAKSTQFEDKDEVLEFDEEESPAQVEQASSVKVTTLAKLKPTQKPKVYLGKATKETQLNPEAKMKLIMQQYMEEMAQVAKEF
jgi:hypothetical protein